MELEAQVAKRAKSIFTQDIEGLADAATALHVRLQDRIRRAILNGSFAPRSRLPSSRLLARDFKVSRHTIELTLDNLQAEGFIERKPRMGTFVAATLPQRELAPMRVPTERRDSITYKPSRRGAAAALYPPQSEPAGSWAFKPSIPALDLFPKRLWAKMVARSFVRHDINPWEYGISAGLKDLRRAITVHVAATRGVICTAEQVIVVTSTQQAVHLAAHVVCDAGDTVWFEEPGHPMVRHVLQSAGLEVVPVPVDADGFDPQLALWKSPRAKLVHVTPSHQYPTGVLMPLERRIALLEWSRTHDGWILEDDYDGDFQYEGRPLASLQALDPGGRVIYMGSFSKMMFPALRLAYIVVPEVLVSVFDSMKHLADGFTALHTQAALAEFIEEGHLAAHLRNMRIEYDVRRRALIKAIAPLEGALRLGPTNAGLHVAAYLKIPLSDEEIVNHCAARGIYLHPLSRYFADKPQPGLLFGFACASPEQIARGMAIVESAFH